MTLRLATTLSSARWFSTSRCSFTPYHNLLGVTVNENPFKVDSRQLKIAYIKAQRLAHPDAQAGRDKAGTHFFIPLSLKIDFEIQGSQDTAAASSAQLTEAYNTLLHPEKRALYLLSLRGVEIGEHDALGGGDEELLSAVMEEQFAIEDAETLDEVVSLREKNESAHYDCLLSRMTSTKPTLSHRSRSSRGTGTGRRV